MAKFYVIFLFFLLPNTGFTQKIEVRNNLIQKKSFVYLFKHYDYITNENAMMTRTQVDSFFFKFTKKADLVYDLNFYLDGDCTVKYNFSDSTYLKTYTFKFNDSGKIVAFLNVDEYRKKIINFEKVLYKKGETSQEYFNTKLAYLNNDMYVLNTINPDFTNMWNPVGDTFNTEVNRIRIRSINSPISKTPIMVPGTMLLENFDNSNTIFKIKARHPASPENKQELVSQLKFYISRMNKENFDKRTEIKEVDLNAEQDWIYNNNTKLISTIFLSDIFVVNRQGRGVVREYNLWDFSEQ